MSDVPFGFGPQDPDEHGDRGSSEGRPGDRPGGQLPGGGFGGMPQGGMPGFDVGALGQMLTQLGQMLSQATSSGGGPVNYQLAKQMAVQRLGSEGAASASRDQRKAVEDAVRLADMWLDPSTALPSGVRAAAAWSARDWVEHTVPSWQRLCDPVANRMSGAWVEALPAEAKETAGPLLSMLGQMGGLAFGSQLGNGLAQLASEVLTSTEVGLPLGPEGVAALLPANVDRFGEGLDRPRSEVLVFLAAREAAHHRLFSHVPWLRQRLMATVEDFARGISVDTSALEDLAGRIDPSDPSSFESVMREGMLEPKTTPAQQVALARLETLLALVEGWVDVVVAEAVTGRLPGADALRETLRRRRASGGPAEQTFATLVGLELRPRRLRAAAELWRALTERHGIEAREHVWEHPDLLPGSDDLDDPTGFADRAGTGRAELEDPIAELERTKRLSDRGEPENPSADDAAGTPGDEPPTERADDDDNGTQGDDKTSD